MEMVLISADDLDKRIREAVRSELVKFKPAAPKEQKYVTVKAAAKKLNCAPLTLYRGIKAGKVPCKIVGSKKLIPQYFLEQ